MIDYEVRRIPAKQTKEYIKANHYSKGCHNGPSPLAMDYLTHTHTHTHTHTLIGVLMFATPCSENVRRSVFGDGYKDTVIELHRLHILDVTPKNTESWFISKCFKLLLKDRPQTRGIISFADSTEGHEGIIYKATNAHRCGSTGKATFYLDNDGRLRHPRQCGVNITLEEAIKRGWTKTVRDAKNRYLWIVGPSKKERKEFIKKCLII